MESSHIHPVLLLKNQQMLFDCQPANETCFPDDKKHISIHTLFPNDFTYICFSFPTLKKITKFTKT